MHAELWDVPTPLAPAPNLFRAGESLCGASKFPDALFSDEGTAATFMAIANSVARRWTPGRPIPQAAVAVAECLATNDTVPAEAARVSKVRSRWIGAHLNEPLSGQVAELLESPGPNGEFDRARTRLGVDQRRGLDFDVVVFDDARSEYRHAAFFRQGDDEQDQRGQMFVASSHAKCALAKVAGRNEIDRLFAFEVLVHELAHSAKSLRLGPKHRSFLGIGINEAFAEEIADGMNYMDVRHALGLAGGAAGVDLLDLLRHAGGEQEPSSVFYPKLYGALGLDHGIQLVGFIPRSCSQFTSVGESVFALQNDAHSFTNVLDSIIARQVELRGQRRVERGLADYLRSLGSRAQVKTRTRHFALEEAGYELPALAQDIASRYLAAPTLQIAM